MFSWLILAWTKQDADIMFSHSMHPNTTIQLHTCWNSPLLNLFVFVTQSWLQIAVKWKAIKLVPATDVCQGFHALPLTSIDHSHCHCHCHWCCCCHWHSVWVYPYLLVFGLTYFRGIRCTPKTQLLFISYNMKINAVINFYEFEDIHWNNVFLVTQFICSSALMS